MGPGGEHVILDAALVAATHNLEVATLTPPGTPRVGRFLQGREDQTMREPRDHFSVLSLSLSLLTQYLTPL